MIYLQLFWSFFKIGLFSFGGGYGMLPLMEQEVLSHSWLGSVEFWNFVAVAESTPGPIAINMATFIGSSQGGILGSLCATLGVITPSIIIILLIVAVFKSFLQNRVVLSALDGIKPVIVGLIFTKGLGVFVKNFLPNITEMSVKGFSLASLLLSIGLMLVYFGYKKIRRKNLSPIIFIILSALCGMIIF